jgi:DNA-binding transcriptional LysR family regulator
MRGLEERLGVRLLTRTTRSVAPTDAGERLMQSLGPRFEEIEAELNAVSALRDKPAGTIRLTAGEHASNTVLWPVIDKLLRSYPDIHAEVHLDNGLADIVTQRYDAGVRLGEQVAKDMISVRIGPDMRMAVVGAPSYFKSRTKPRNPQDLTEHSCINLRFQTYGGLYAWELEKARREMKVRVEGQLTFNSNIPILTAALAGHGLAYVLEDQVTSHVEEGRLIRYSPTGARLFPVTICITQASGSRPQPSPWWWRHCATACELSPGGAIARVVRREFARLHS